MTRTILHAASFAAEQPGNFVAALQALARAGETRGFRQAFVFPAAAASRPWFAELLAAGRDVSVLPGGGLRRTARALTELARDRDAFLLHSHFGALDLPAWLAARTLSARGRPCRVLWHLHSDLERGGGVRRRLRETLRWRILSRGVRLAAVAPHIREQAVARGADPARILVLPNGVDSERARQAEAADVRRAAGIGLDDTALVAFTWHPEWKGADVALDAVESLASAASPPVLALVGSRRLEAFVRARYGDAPPPWLRVLPPRSHPAEYYRLAAAFVSPSRGEGMPYSVVEAMLNARPVVLSDIPGHRPFLEAPGAVGFAPGDAAALAAALRDVLAWPDAERARRGEANRAFAEGRFGMRAWTKGMLEIYGDILDGL